MKYVEQQNIKKLCNFYVSDMHLSVMLIPYINKEINEDVEITTIFEKLEKQNIKDVLEKLNIKNKEKILNIEWFNSNKDTYEKINKKINDDIEKNKKVTIIIGGSKEYILKNNTNIVNLLKNTNCKQNMEEIKIINCFNIEDVGTDAKNIVEKYDEIMNTKGEFPVSAITI